MRKRTIPRFPRRVAVITSRDGAALRDIYAVAQRRCPSVEIVLIPAIVQGDYAVESLCDALDQMCRWADADTLIIGRGGGGREDLWAFNDERVARAVAACPIPTISAVGHEIDMSICDLVADLRAPTPSAAAEAAVPLQAEMRERLRLAAATLSELAGESLERARARIVDLADAMSSSSVRHVQQGRIAMESAAARLNVQSPLATLERGYSLVRTPEGKTVRSVKTLERGSDVDVVFRDGVAQVTVQQVPS
jgi:exodeoxyribonuclease VII large subunit